MNLLTNIVYLSRKNIFTFLLYWFFLISPLLSFSQSPKRTFEKILVTIDEVSYDLNITSIKQDHQGYLWMSTNKGLIKYDGYEFIRYLNIPGDSTSLINNNTESLYVDSTGALWIGTSHGLSRYDSGCDCFFQYRSSPDNLTPTGFITTMTEDASQNLWIGMEDGGLFRYERDSDRFTRFLDDPTDPNTLVGEIVRVLLADRQNNIWIGTGFGKYENAGGLIRFDPTTGTSNRYLHEPNNANSLIDNRVSALMEDQEGRILAGTYQNGLHYYDPEKDEFIRMVYDAADPDRLYPPPGHKVWEMSPFITILHQDQKGGFWIGTCGGGINYFDPNSNKVSHFVHDSASRIGITNDKLWSFFEDRSGQIWLGTLTQGGLHKMDPFAPEITRYTESNNKHVLRIRESREEPGIIFLGTYNHGIQRLDLKTDEIKPLFHKSKFRESSVYDIYEDTNGLLWIGFGTKVIQSNILTTEIVEGGLAHFDTQSGKLKHYANQANDSLGFPINSVYRICEDRDGFLWLGTGKSGLFRFDKNKESFKHYNLSGDKGPARDSEIYLIEEDSKGTLWIGDIEGEGALFRYNRENESFDSFIEGYKPICFYEDGFNRFWVGTENNGLLQFDPTKNSFHQYTMADGLPSNKVLGVLEGSAGIYWVSTYQGLSKLDAESKRFISTGLPSHRFNEAILKSSDGQMFFGGSSVLFSFFPDQVSGNLIPPQLILSGLRISGVPYDLENGTYGNSEKITLSHYQNDLMFEYTGLHYSKSSKNQYKYKLEPFDLNWIEAGSQRTVQYTNLDPGEYNFQVIGSNDNDVWSETGPSVQLLIKTAWWVRWWAYLLYLTIFSVITYGLYRFQLSRKLAIEEGRRLKEVHQFRNSLYTNITHEFRTPLTVILGMTNQLKSKVGDLASEGTSKPLEMIHRSGENLLQMVNEILDLSKLDSGNLEMQLLQADVIPYVKYLCESFCSLAQESNIDLKVHSETDQLVMDFDAGKLRTILSNLLSNAIKFTPTGQKISIHLKETLISNEPYFVVVVKDTGVGIPEDQLAKVFDRFYQVDQTSIKQGEGTGIGLALTKELVRLMKGSIDVKSTLGEGTEFTVQIPITNNSVKEEEVGLPLTTKTHISATESDVINEIHPGNDELPLALIIEDNQDVAYYLKTFLEKHFQILSCQDGKEGVDRALEVLPDIIISDVMMPEMDGFQVCAILKEDERTSHIPIVLLTAKATSTDRITGLTEGADAYLVKPFEKEELLIRMKGLMEIRRKLQKKYSRSLISLGTKTVENREEFFLRKLENIILSHLEEEDFSGNELAQELFISRSQLYRKIKALTGKSTSLYIRFVRLQKAKELLASNTLRISEVAYRVGFKSPVYFSQVYKDTFGESPTETRK